MILCHDLPPYNNTTKTFFWHDFVLRLAPYVKSPNQFENTSYKQHGLNVYICIFYLQ